MLWMVRCLFGENVIPEAHVAVKGAAVKAAYGIFRLSVMSETVVKMLRKKLYL